MYRVKGADQKEYGPVSAEQIIQWIGENRLNRFSLVQKEGDPSWKPLDQYPEFAATLAAAPTPTPVATPGTSGTPYVPTQPTQPVYTPVADPKRAASMVKAPAIAMIILAAVGMLLSIAGFVAKPRMLDVFMEAAANAGATIPPETLDALRAEQTKGIGPRDYLNLGLSLVLYGVVIAGSLKMMRLENWGLALTAGILSMLPCTCCCCIGIPIGVWAVIVLNQAEVKKSFR
ncbi:MAG: DUF4339 domain-containing protein [Verrucomicrobia bacterium]|nr:DUF4339 domain-containing protein [Verrucomicrobiota bacterium]